MSQSTPAPMVDSTSHAAAIAAATALYLPFEQLKSEYKNKLFSSVVNLQPGLRVAPDPLQSAWYQPRLKIVGELAELQKKLIREIDIVGDLIQARIAYNQYKSSNGMIAPAPATTSVTAEEDYDSDREENDIDVDEIAELRKVKRKLRTLQLDVISAYMKLAWIDAKGKVCTSAKIGLVGLEKVGKSSLLGAWAAKWVDLLPTAMDRCTGCITNVLYHNNPNLFIAQIFVYSLSQFIQLVNGLCQTANLMENGVVLQIIDLSDGNATRIRNALQQCNPPQGDQFNAKLELKDISQKFPSIRSLLQAAPFKFSFEKSNKTEFAAELFRYVTLDGPFPRAVRKVDVYACLDSMGDNCVELIDMPGVNSPSKFVNDIAATAVKRELDLVVFLHQLTNPQFDGNSEDPFFANIYNVPKELQRTVMMVYTKLDKEYLEFDDKAKLYKPAFALHCLRKHANENLANIPEKYIHFVSGYWFTEHKGFVPPYDAEPIREFQALLKCSDTPPDGVDRLKSTIAAFLKEEMPKQDVRILASLSRRERILFGGENEKYSDGQMRQGRVRALLTKFNVGEGANTDALLIKLINGAHGQTGLQQAMRIALTYDQREFIAKGVDAKIVSEIMSLFYNSMTVNLNIPDIGVKFDTMIAGSNSRACTLADFEAEMRQWIYRDIDGALDSALGLWKKAIESSVDDYINRFCYARINKDETDPKLFDMLQNIRSIPSVVEILDAARRAAMQTISQSVLEPVLEDLRYVVGVSPNGPKSVLDRMKTSGTYINKANVADLKCKHESAWFGNDNGTFTELLVLPFYDKSFDKAGFDKLVFLGAESCSFTAEQKLTIVQTIYTRCLAAVDHLCELATARLMTNSNINTSRANALNTLTNILLPAMGLVGQNVPAWDALVNIISSNKIKVFPSRYRGQNIEENFVDKCKAAKKEYI